MYGRLAKSKFRIASFGSALCLLLVSWIAALSQQMQKSPPRFEVASVRAHVLTNRSQMTITGGPGTNAVGQFSAIATPLWTFVVLAYHISSNEIEGPEWLRSARYDIVAKVPRGTTRKDFWLMLQRLLADRFKLTTHRVLKERPVYKLIVSKSGLKMRRVDDASHREDRIEEPESSSAPAKSTMGKDGFPVLSLEPAARSGIAMGQIGRVTEWMGKLTMEGLASRLSSRLGHPVIDETGLKGRYDITLRYRFAASSPVDETPGSDTVPDPIAALETQLGLRLVMTKGMRPVLVIDHVEKTPTEN